MNWRHIEDIRPIARQPHICVLCERAILPGNRYVRRMGFDEGGLGIVMVMHEHCEYATHGWDATDWEVGTDATEFRTYELGE